LLSSNPKFVSLKLSNIDSSKKTKNPTQKNSSNHQVTKKQNKKTKQNGRAKKRFLLLHFVNYYICEKKKKQKLFMEIKEFWTKPMNFLCDKY